MNQEDHFGSGLTSASTPEEVRWFLESGADPLNLEYGTRRKMLGLTPVSVGLLKVTLEDFLRYRSPRFGTYNPEKMNNPFWEGMIRSGLTAYNADMTVLGKSDWYPGREPTWCADRFGQSITFLPDGRVVQIAGEHEDAYDPDFCIYNDVFIHDPDGNIDIYGYPETVFPPTDFHTATLSGSYIYLIGSLGYMGARLFGETQVYRLDIRSFAIEHLETKGACPGWISRHRAVRAGSREIRVTGGEIVTCIDGEEIHSKNVSTYYLDIKSLVWRS